MRIGSMFSGLLGGLDIACERVFNAETAWQLDITGASVRRRHWPDAVQVEADVRTVDPADLARVDVLCGGFPCQDLSVAGKGEGLDGARSGLYRHMLRFADAMQPQFVVFENVSPLLNVLDVLAADLRRSGYGLTYAVCEAADAGLPHLRRRVFVVAERGVAGRGRVEVDTSRRWSAVESEREWATISASNVNEGETPESWEARRQLNLARHKNGNGQGEPLAMQVREWATATATDYKTPAGFVRQGHQPARIGEQFIHEAGKRLNPAWVETLMGVPQGWTLPDGLSLRDQLDGWRAPRGRYPATWDRSVPWPGFAWEPSRTLPDGPPASGRPARIKGLGNGVVWQQAVLGLDACVNGCATGQVPMFGGAA